jgi:hypothetical protein
MRTGDTDIDRGETSCGRVDVEVEVAMDVEVEVAMDVEVEVAMDVEVEDSAVENTGQPR